LVACAVELIAEVGYPQASLSKIAERAGVAKSVVLYHFAGKEELVYTLAMDNFRAAATYLVPAVRAQETARDKLATYTRQNGRFIDDHRSHALALFDIFTSYRSPRGKRVDEMLLERFMAEPPEQELTELDPSAIFVLGQRTGEFRDFPVPAMTTALRQSIEGAVLQTSRDKDFDVTGYIEQVVTIFDLATKKGEP
jgi:TetR/AcrR family fatty acid metabolism transcriptional regulator